MGKGNTNVYLMNLISDACRTRFQVLIFIILLSDLCFKTCNLVDSYHLEVAVDSLTWVARENLALKLGK